MNWKAKCLVDFCTLPAIAKSLCKRHYPMVSRGRSPYGPYLSRKKTTPRVYPDCDFEGCTHKAKAQKGGVCMSHRNHAVRGEELRPLNYVNQGFTETGRVCKDCKVDKPLTEYYTMKRETGKHYRTNCKDCYKIDAGYYQGKHFEKADGSDPMGWKDNPSAMQAKYEEVKRKAVEDYRSRNERM